MKIHYNFYNGKTLCGLRVPTSGTPDKPGIEAVYFTWNATPKNKRCKKCDRKPNKK